MVTVTLKILVDYFDVEPSPPYQCSPLFKMTHSHSSQRDPNPTSRVSLISWLASLLYFDQKKTIVDIYNKVKLVIVQVFR